MKEKHLAKLCFIFRWSLAVGNGVLQWSHLTRKQHLPCSTAVEEWSCYKNLIRNQGFILVNAYCLSLGPPRWLDGRILLPSTRCGFYPWVRKIPLRRKWQPSPVFLPGKSHGQKSLMATVHGVTKSWTWLCDQTATAALSFSKPSLKCYYLDFFNIKSILIKSTRNKFLSLNIPPPHHLPPLHRYKIISLTWIFIDYFDSHQKLGMRIQLKVHVNWFRDILFEEVFHGHAFFLLLTKAYISSYGEKDILPSVIFNERWSQAIRSS